MVTGMDLYLDRLLNLPNTTVESFTEEENKITLKLRFLQDEITCPHCNTHGGKLKQNRPILIRDLSVFGKIVGSSGFKGISKSNEKDKLII
ncbi:MAG: transposase family protein [Pseudanabaena sp. Salubria-1]|nr:transposase family protein [Pseudanabaena sp. Salubria-1]